MSIRTTLIEDSEHYRSSLETLLLHTDGFELVASFGSADAALRELAATSPRWDLVLMDIELPGTNGIEATRAIKRELPDVSVVMLTVFEEPSVILEAIGAGADGYLLKKTSAREIVTQLRVVVKGGAPLTAGVARTLLELLRNPATLQASAEPQAVAPGRLKLTDREQDVLRCLVGGLSYQAAADELGVHIDTVRTHIRAVYRKLQVHSVAEAVQRAIRERLV